MQVFSKIRGALLLAAAVALATPLLIPQLAQASPTSTPSTPDGYPFIFLPIITTNPPLTADAAQSTPIRAVRVQYNNYQNSQAEAPAIEASLRAAQVNLVALSAGRVEWAYLNWRDHPEFVSSSVKDSGVDILAADSIRYGQFAHINAVIDVLSPNYIAAHPGTAAINALGQPNPNLVGTMELVNGNYGKYLLQMVEYIAANYPKVDSISLTELSYRLDGYGPAELASYQAATGRADWPRLSNGQINIDDPSIGTWRSNLLGAYLAKLSDACHAHGKAFYLDVPLSWSHPETGGNEFGLNYALMLQHVDKLVVWGYYYLENQPPEALATAAAYLARYGSDKIIMSIGLWGPNNSTLPADLLARGIQASIQGGLPSLWITPSIYLSAAGWATLDQAWAAPN